jgi:tripartite-type tricarboxylate transporter receptor subunit TctC
MTRRDVLAATGGATLALSLGRPAVIAAEGPVELVVPAPAGSRTDLSARILATHLSKALGRPVEPVNAEGPSGAGFAQIAGAAPDGRRIGMLTVDITFLNRRGLSPLRPGDFTPLGLVDQDPAGIHVKAGGPWTSARQLHGHIAANPGKLKVSGAGRGGIWHLSTVGWIAASGLPGSAVVWSAAPGPLAAVGELDDGTVDVVVCSVPEVRGTAAGRKARTLAVMAERRAPRFGDVPTLGEALGRPYAAGVWRGIAAPKGLPAATAAALGAALQRTWASGDYQRAMIYRGFNPQWSGGPAFARFMAAGEKSMAQTLAQAGLLQS